jgi:Ni2+-binding GTPase involved in maturation of urease and hydrogenase
MATGTHQTTGRRAAPATHRPLLVGVGGFLGAGKTTAIIGAARVLRARGRRVAVITNDQASGLVDTAAARAALGPQGVAEIAGGCFCCRFEDLAGALHEVIERATPDVILAEAVGSCTDLAATVYQPLRQLGLAPVRLGPLTVVADALRLRHLRRGGALPLLPPDVTYLYGQQLREADLLLLNKIDLLPGAETVELAAFLQARTPGVPVLPVSASTGQGLEAWTGGLEAALDGPQPDPGGGAAGGGSNRLAGGGAAGGGSNRLAGGGPAPGSRVLDLDYDRYADAEAALGWLNAEGQITSPAGEQDYGETWAHAALSGLAALAREAGAEVAHAKLRLDAAGSSCVANLVQNAGPPFVRCAGRLAGPAALVLNARVAAAPALVRAWTEAALAEADARAATETTLREVRCFAPARPVPTYRLSA